MLNVSIRRKILVLLVMIAVLATPWASAAGPQPQSPQSVQAFEPAALDPVSRIWSFVRSVGSRKAGCNIDPNGRCTPKNPPPQTKEGCNIDPWGHCNP